jgi:hypothetical protein
MKCSKLEKGGSHRHRDSKAEARKRAAGKKKWRETRLFAAHIGRTKRPPVGFLFFLFLLSFLVSRGDSE